MNMEEQELYRLASNFRKAIEEAKMAGISGEFFRKFPSGQCTRTSDMLAQYFIDCGINNKDKIFLVNGSYYGHDQEDQWSHAWLEVNGIAVDITGDQYKCHCEPLKNDIAVYVGPSTTMFYNSFERDPQGEYKHSGLQEDWPHYKDLRDWYEIILSFCQD